MELQNSRHNNVLPFMISRVCSQSESHFNSAHLWWASQWGRVQGKKLRTFCMTTEEDRVWWNVQRAMGWLGSPKANMAGISRAFEGQDMSVQSLVYQDTGKKKSYHWPSIEVNFSPPMFQISSCTSWFLCFNSSLLEQISPNQMCVPVSLNLRIV